MTNAYKVNLTKDSGNPHVDLRSAMSSEPERVNVRASGLKVGAD
jgi:hypothetical protein